jgi:hypothetical protein
VYWGRIEDTVGELTVAQLSKLAVWRCSVENQDRILGYIAGFRIRQQYRIERGNIL